MKTYNQKQTVSHLTVTFNPEVPRKDRLQVNTIKNVYNAFIALWDETKINRVEEVKVMYLDETCGVIGIFDLSTGDDNQVTFDIKLLAGIGVQVMAKAFILAHNHTDGPLVPSFTDIITTETTKASCRLLNLHLLDHLIISNDNYYSFLEDGLL